MIYDQMQWVNKNHSVHLRFWTTVNVPTSPAITAPPGSAWMTGADSLFTIRKIMQKWSVEPSNICKYLQKDLIGELVMTG